MINLTKNQTINGSSEYRVDYTLYLNTGVLTSGSLGLNMKKLYLAKESVDFEVHLSNPLDIATDVSILIKTYTTVDESFLFTIPPLGTAKYIDNDWEIEYANGQSGSEGPPGPQGIQGIQGVPGNDGNDGINGIDGIDGIDGVNGIDGVDGNDGATGPTGPTGATGPQGIQGIQGIQGVPGNDGVDGVDGIDGIDGAPGATGATGATGPAGAGITQQEILRFINSGL